MAARLIDLIADHIRAQRSGNTYVEIDEEMKTVRVDGIPIGLISDKTIDVGDYDRKLVLDSRDPSFFPKLDHALYEKLDTSYIITTRRAYRERKEVEWRNDFFKRAKET